MNNNLHTNVDILNLIKQYKKFSRKTFKINNQSLIGYEHLQENQDEINIITEKEALQFLKDDCIIFENIVKRYVQVELTENQLSALVSLVMDIGERSFSQSKMLSFINKKAWNHAACEFPKWTLDQLNNLTKREKEKEIFLL